MTQLPCVVQAEYRGQYRILVTFNDGSEKMIDFLGWLEGPIFEPLKDVTLLPTFLYRRRDHCLAKRSGYCARDLV